MSEQLLQLKEYIEKNVVYLELDDTETFVFIFLDINLKNINNAKIFGKEMILDMKQGIVKIELNAETRIKLKKYSNIQIMSLNEKQNYKKLEDIQIITVQN